MATVGVKGLIGGQRHINCCVSEQLPPRCHMIANDQICVQPVDMIPDFDASVTAIAVRQPWSLWDEPHRRLHVDDSLPIHGRFQEPRTRV